MPEPVIKPFVFNDETIANTYGFYILTEGIDLTRFSKNPVMLSDHWNSNKHVLGKWSDWRKEGTTLSGLPIFDTEDEDAAKIARKVEKGFLSGCSMGIIVDRENLTYIDGKIFLTKCELAEVSIVPVPSNANAVRLMHEDGKVMDEKEIKTLCLSIVPGAEKTEFNLINQKMKKVLLSVATLMALGFKDQPADGLEVSEVEGKIAELSGQVVKLTAKNQELELAAQTTKEAQEAAIKLSVEKKVKLAIAAGKFGADKEAEMVTLGLASESALDTVIGSIPAKRNFGADVNPETGKATEVKTMDDFEKLSEEAKLSFKNDNPEEYKKIFS